VNASDGSWQVAQDRVPLGESRVSKKRSRPRSASVGVGQGASKAAKYIGSNAAESKMLADLADHARGRSGAPIASASWAAATAWAID